MKLAYLTNCFGSLSHTFIRRELRDFESRAYDVSLYGIHKDQNPAPDSIDLVEKTEYLYPINLLATAWLNIYYSLRHPIRYWKAVASCLMSTDDTIKQRLTLLYHLCVSTRFANLMHNKKITHIHVHFLNVSATVGMFCSRLTGIPYSITIHSAGEKNLGHVIGIKLKLRYAQSLLMISNYNIDYYNAIEPCRERSHVVRCGMDMSNFHFKPQAPNSTEDLKILAVGRFVEKKGFEYLIDAAAILNSQGMRFVIEILGSGPLEASLQSKVNELHLQEKVLLPGRVSTEEVKAKMLASNLVVVPSVTSKTGEMEGLPVVVMEAMALGIPVLATAHSGIPELVMNSTGDLVPERDADALARAITSFSFDKEKLKKARKLIEEQFNINTVVTQRLQLFK